TSRVIAQVRGVHNRPRLRTPNSLIILYFQPKLHESTPSPTPTRVSFSDRRAGALRTNDRRRPRTCATHAPPHRGYTPTVQNSQLPYKQARSPGSALQHQVGSPARRGTNQNAPHRGGGWKGTFLQRRIFGFPDYLRHASNRTMFVAWQATASSRPSSVAVAAERCRAPLSAPSSRVLSGVPDVPFRFPSYLPSRCRPWPRAAARRRAGAARLAAFAGGRVRSCDLPHVLRRAGGPAATKGAQAHLERHGDLHGRRRGG